MKFHILTLFPDMVAGGLAESITGRAAAEGKIEIHTVNIRDYTENKHKKVDDYPYGGGAGMLMQAQPVYDAFTAVKKEAGEGKALRVVYLTPQGRTFNQELAEEFAKEEELVLLCGHYEGIDERVLRKIVTDPVSLGDFVLTGGELPAMVVVDAVARLVPGVLHNGMSAEKESFQGSLLEYPQYTRPEVWMGERVPEVLLSGDHKKVERWRRERAVERTRRLRPDLHEEYERGREALRLLLFDKPAHIDMIEALRRENAKLLHAGEDGVLLREKKSGIYMLTASDETAAQAILEGCGILDEAAGEKEFCLVMHQDYMRERLTGELGLHAGAPCRQAVYTRNTPLRVSGGFSLRPLEERYLELILKTYRAAEDTEYIRGRAAKGVMYGAFLEESLAGFIGLHEEGSMGMLEVLEPYRRRGAALALESDCINRQLSLGFLPYCQIDTENEASFALQRKLGLRISEKELIWYTKRKG